MRRPHRIAAVVAMVVVIAVAVGLQASGLAPWAPEEPPNFIVIVTDDQPPGSMSVLPETTTWFRGGTTYTQAYVTTPLCCPSRASIFSGRFAHNHGITSNSATRQAEAFEQRSTMQAVLERAGYDTGIFGKYLNSWELTANPPHFDEWAIFTKAERSYVDGEWNVDGKVEVVQGYATDFIAEGAEAFIRARAESERPWILFLFPPNPHRPFTPAENDVDAPLPPAESSPAIEERDVSDKPPFVRRVKAGPRRAEELRTAQLRSLLPVDNLVARVRASLQETEQEADTMTLLTSDNGYLWGEHGLIKKGYPYTRSVRVPMMIRWPQSYDRPAGSDDILVTNVDIAPTILELAGIEDGPRMDGRSLVADGERDVVFMEYYPQPYFKIPRWDSVRTHDLQYVQYYGEGASVIYREFYDLREDPWQTENLLGDDAMDNDPDVAEFVAMIRRFRRCSDGDCP